MQHGDISYGAACIAGDASKPGASQQQLMMLAMYVALEQTFSLFPSVVVLGETPSVLKPPYPEVINLPNAGAISLILEPLH